jgi:hypothetical protein
MCPMEAVIISRVSGGLGVIWISTTIKKRSYPDITSF